MEIRLDTVEIFERAKAKLANTYTLVYAAYDDQLTDDQIARALDGDAPDDSFDDWYSEARRYGVDHVIEELVPDSLQRQALRRSDEYHLLAEEITDRDDSEVWDDLLRNTHDKLFRYRLGPADVDLDDAWDLAPDSWRWDDAEIDEAAAKLAAQAGVDFAAHAEAFRELVVESTYGGQLFAIWYGPVAPMVTAALDEGEAARTIRFTGKVRLVVLDSYNGSGHDVGLDDVTVTAPFHRDRLVLDDKAWGYSWSATCDPYLPAYKAEPTITTDTTDTTEEH